MKPITATVTKPEPPPEPVRPRLTAVLYQLYHPVWYVSLKTQYDVTRNAGYREVTIPTDAEIERDARIAEAHARYVAALEAFFELWEQTIPLVNTERMSVYATRAEWEAERGKS